MKRRRRKLTPAIFCPKRIASSPGRPDIACALCKVSKMESVATGDQYDLSAICDGDDDESEDADDEEDEEEDDNDDDTIWRRD
jgi:hypothetical protein